MDKLSFLSVRYWIILCCYASFAFVLTLPAQRWSDSIYLNTLLIVAASVALAKYKLDYWMKMLCVSLLFSSVFGIVTTISLSEREAISNNVYYVLFYFVTLCPLIYSLLKEKEWTIRSGVIVIGIALISYLLYVFTAPLFIGITKGVFSLSMTGFFWASAMDTSNQKTRYISYLAVAGALTLLLQNIENIAFALCEKPDSILNDYDADRYSVFYFCVEYSSLFSYARMIGGVLMLTYFFHILKRSNYMLKSVSIPAIVACVLLILMENIDSLPFRYDTIEKMYYPFYAILYTLFIFSFYKLQKQL